MKVLFLCLLLPSIGCASLSKLDVSEAVVALEALKVKEATTSYDPFVVIKHLESKKVVQFRKNGGVIYISFPIAYANSTELPDGVGLTHYTDQPMQSKPDFINGEERKSIYYGKEALIGKLLVSFGMKKKCFYTIGYYEGQPLAWIYQCEAIFDIPEKMYGDFISSTFYSIFRVADGDISVFEGY